MGETKIGLVLEGGGMRGVYTAGVLDAFLDAGLEFDGTLGVSAGSCHAASFLSKQRGRAYRVNVSYLNDWRYCSARSWLTTGDFFGAKMLYDTIPNQLDLYDHTAFEQRRGWFRAVVTNLASGEAEYPVIEDLHRDIIWLQASSSLPLLSRTVKIEGQEYLDGGISDSIPVKAVSYTHLDVFYFRPIIPQALFEAQVNIPCEIYADTAIGFANGWEPWYNETWSLEGYSGRNLFN